jgi:hypothetical protein
MKLYAFNYHERYGFVYFVMAEDEATARNLVSTNMEPWERQRLEVCVFDVGQVAECYLGDEYED